jgi:hypothetical protein
MLPPLDPDYLIEERDPARLQEYAASLLQHLCAIRQGGPSNGYGVDMIRDAADWLLWRYAETGAAVPAEAFALWSEMLCAKRTSRTGARVQERLLDAYREAYMYDAAYAEDPPLYAVAKHVRKTGNHKWKNQEAAEATIRAWRKQSHYRDQVRLNRTKG